MSTLARGYLALSLSLLVAGGVFAYLSLRAPGNDDVVTLYLLLPRLDADAPYRQLSRHLSLRALAAGWAVLGGVLAFWIVRLPFRIRREAALQRKVREYRAEVLELRTLPLREAEEDAALAAEARLDMPRPKVMTAKIDREETASSEDGAR
ncbi:MAG: hypothetical protein B7733_14620 [Myxococcales bacterium FL481]|nr:MAG: hypothetical protein B7733_14620 [Myxococcales bacterium FL481]